MTCYLHDFPCLSLARNPTNTLLDTVIPLWAPTACLLTRGFERSDMLLARPPPGIVCVWPLFVYTRLLLIYRVFGVIFKETFYIDILFHFPVISALISLHSCDKLSYLRSMVTRPTPSPLRCVFCSVIASRLQPILPSLACVKLRQPTLGALNCSVDDFLSSQIRLNSHHGGTRPRGSTLQYYHPRVTTIIPCLVLLSPCKDNG